MTQDQAYFFSDSPLKLSKRPNSAASQQSLRVSNLDDPPQESIIPLINLQILALVFEAWHSGADAALILD